MAFRVTAVLWVLVLTEEACSKRQSPSAVQTKLAGEPSQEVQIVAEEVNPSQKVQSVAEADDKATVSVQAQAQGWSRWWKHVFAGVSTAIFVKISCLVGNMLVQVSPFTKVQEWEVKGSTGEADPAPFISIGLGGWQWSTYGLAAWMVSNNDTFLVLVYSNFLGALLGSYYTFAFSKLCRNAETWAKMKQYLKGAGSMVTVQMITWLLLPHERALAFHSCAAALCSFLVSVSLMLCLPTVMRTHDTSDICGPLVLSNFFGALMWVYWGFIMADPAIVGTNMFAAFASACCLCLKMRYGATSKCADCSETKMGDAWGAKRTYQRKGFAPKEPPQAVPAQKQQLVASTVPEQEPQLVASVQ